MDTDTGFILFILVVFTSLICETCLESLLIEQFIVFLIRRWHAI